MKTRYALGTVMVVTLLLASCTGGDDDNNLPIEFKTTMGVPNVGSTTNFSFDISAVDPVNGRYYFTDRNNKSVDVFDIKTNTFIKQIHQDFLKSGGFAKFLVQWIFDAKIGDFETVKTEMINALHDEMQKPAPRITQAEADAIERRLNWIIRVGL